MLIRFLLTFFLVYFFELRWKTIAKSNSTIISINLKNDVLLKVDNQSKKEDKNRSELINQILKAALTDNQYYFKIKRREAEIEFIKYDNLLKKMKWLVKWAVEKHDISGVNAVKRSSGLNGRVWIKTAMFGFVRIVISIILVWM